MFTPKGLFSQIQCPYIDQCVLPNCLFSHAPNQILAPLVPSDGNETLSTPLSLQSSAPLLKSTGDRDDRRSKRQKLNEDASSQSITNALVTGSKAVPPTFSSPKSVGRGVSPPPLRRAVDTRLRISSSTPGKVVVKPKPKVPAPLQEVKVETLNPRLLKQAPASHDLRFRLVKALHEQLVRLNGELAKDADTEVKKLLLSDQLLIKMALDIEEYAAIGKPSIYSNVVKNNILKYKRMLVKDWKSNRITEVAAGNAVKAESEGHAKIAKPVEPSKPVETGLSLNEELLLLPRLHTSLEGLSKHGYVTKIPSADAILLAEQGVEAAKGWEICDRCKTRFQVFPGRRDDGSLTSGGSCTHHWGKPYFPEKTVGEPKAKRERKYRCCHQAVGDSPGCIQGDCHVFKITEVKRLAAVLNFEETPRNDSVSNGPVCIDGEMGYTVYGLELIRLTATAWHGGEELLDVLVRPVGEVLDLNSRFSGVWPQQMSEAIPYDETSESSDKIFTPGRLPIVASPAAARNLLYKHLTPHTPLIGHGLENDLNALRLIHPTVIDTALLYPHKAGLPYRNGLKMLMQQHLGRQIQAMKVVDGKMEGHDSKEDARAAGDLVKLALKTRWDKMKRDGWVIEDGQLIEPSPKTVAQSGQLSIDFLERPYLEESDGALKSDGAKATPAVKRPAAEISGGEVEEGEIAEN